MKVAVAAVNIQKGQESLLYELIEAANCFNVEPNEIDMWILQPQDSNIDETILTGLKVGRVVIVSSDELNLGTSDIYLNVLEGLHEKYKPEAIIFWGDFSGMELSMRLGYRLGGASLVGVTEINQKSDGLHVIKPVYSGNMYAEFILKKRLNILSIAKGTFKADAKRHSDGYPIVEKLQMSIEVDTTWIKDIQLIPNVVEDNLQNARVIVAAGRGIPNRKSYEEIERFADCMGGKAGASRPVVMSAWTGMNKLIGVSGCVVSPDICFAVAVSGSSPFAAGVKNSELLIAINSDKHAPIFKVSHVGMIDDYKDIICELMEIVCREKENNLLGYDTK